MRRKRQTPQISRAEALAARPLVHPSVRAERRESGIIRLFYPLPARPVVVRIARMLGREPVAPIKQLDLDEMGTTVWDLLDGHRTVKLVVESFAAQYQLHPREAEVSVTAFLRELGRRGLIGMR